MPYKVGIAGYGKMGKMRAQTILNHSDLELKYIFDPNYNKIDYGDLIFCNNYEDLLNSDSDIIFLAGYVKDFADYTIKALNKGKHVFCEKPPARNCSELDKVKKHFIKSNLILKYGFNHRYHYSVISAKKIFDENKIGKILLVRGVYGKAGSIDFDKNWRNYKKISGGGILIDQGIHMLDLIMYLSGEEFKCSSSLVRTSHWNIKCEDNTMALLESKSGIIGNIHSSATQWRHKFNLEIYGSSGYVILDGILSSTMSYAPEKLILGKRVDENNEISMGRPLERIFVYDKDDSYLMEIEEFVNAIKFKSKIKNGTLENSIKVMTLLEDIYSKNINSW